MLSPEESKVLSDAADLMGAKHGSPLPEMIYPLMVMMAQNYPISGGGARENWLKALRALGETCLTVEKLAHRK